MINIKTDSRKVVKGDTFVAIKGYTVDGHDFIESAISNGAVKIICEHGDYSVPTLRVKNTTKYLAEYLKDNYSKNLEKLKIIGITGTNGKTTTCYLLYNALLNLNRKVAYIGTIGFHLNGKMVKELPNTTPDVLEMYNLLYECIDNGVEFVVMEVSSHALSLNRLCGISFDVALFTNLTKDHLDYHKTLDAYADAKHILFTKLKNNKIAIINNDANYKEKMFVDGNNNITYGFSDSDYTVTYFETNSKFTKFKFEHNSLEYTVVSTLSGKHNVYNVLSMLIILFELKFDVTSVLKIISDLKAPSGRMEKYYYKGNTVIIDYAHTPDAEFNIITATKEFAKGKIITLIGCGGDRDKTKRPEMARIATQLSDFSIFTSDNPRTENPQDILNDMIKGISNNKYIEIIDRKDAIKYGIDMLKENDILLILGKGHEDYQIVGHEKIHLSDKEIAKNYIDYKLKNNVHP